MTAYNRIAANHAGHDDFLPHMSPTNWLRDMAAHTRLMVEFHQISHEQTEVMERLRCARADGHVTINVRMVDDQMIISEGPDLAQMEHDLALLDHRVAVLHDQMRVLEGRILTFPPQNDEHVAMLLAFLGKVMRLEHRLDDEYLADLMDDYADLCRRARPARLRSVG